MCYLKLDKSSLILTKRAEITIEKNNAFETHYCFTSSEYAAISAFYMTDLGKEYEAVEDGRIAFDGEYPIIPYSGLIGCGHPVGSSGVRMMLYPYRQVAGIAGTYLIKGIRNGIMLNCC